MAGEAGSRFSPPRSGSPRQRFGFPGCVFPGAGRKFQLCVCAMRKICARRTLPRRALLFSLTRKTSVAGHFIGFKACLALQHRRDSLFHQ